MRRGAAWLWATAEVERASKQPAPAPEARAALSAAGRYIGWGDGVLLSGGRQGAARLYRRAALRALSALLARQDEPRSLVAAAPDDWLEVQGLTASDARAALTGPGASVAPEPLGALARTLLARGRRPLVARRAALARRAARVGLALAALITVLVLSIRPLRAQVFPRNIAKGKSFRASSGAYGTATTGTIPAEPPDQYFVHSENEEWPWVEVDLRTVRPVRGVVVENRGDCCAERAIPLWVEVSKDASSWTVVAERRAPFTSWAASFPVTRARFVRFRVARKSTLHLRYVTVY